MAATLAEACRFLLDQNLPDGELRSQVFSKTPHADLPKALDQITALIRPPDDVFYQELEAQYRSVRRYLPTVLKYLRFESSPAGKDVVAAFDWLRASLAQVQRARRLPARSSPSLGGVMSCGRMAKSMPMPTPFACWTGFIAP
jgi:hypothetical protein